MTTTTTVRSTLVAFAAAVLAISTGATAGHAGAGTSEESSAKPMTMAVIGDVPYGSAQEASFGQLIEAVNADPQVREVIHLGDIKSGSTTCTDERFAAVAAAFDTFKDPLLYTPGDNEWTDCHRVNNG